MSNIQFPQYRAPKSYQQLEKSMRQQQTYSGQMHRPQISTATPYEFLYSPAATDVFAPAYESAGALFFPPLPSEPDYEVESMHLSVGGGFGLLLIFGMIYLCVKTGNILRRNQAVSAFARY